MGYKLANLTDGGEGISGYKHTEEFKNKLSATKKGQPSKKKGVPISNEIKRKIAISHIGKTLSQETKNKIAAANKRRIISEETRKKLSIAAKKREAKKRH